MKKAFVKVISVYSPKNKLNNIIIDELKHFDCVLFATRSDANKIISSTFMTAVKNYLKSGGKAHIPDLREYQTDTGIGVSVEGSIILAIHDVKEEM